MFPVVPKDTSEAQGKEPDNQPNLAFFLLIDKDFRELMRKLKFTTQTSYGMTGNGNNLPIPS